MDQKKVNKLFGLYKSGEVHKYDGEWVIVSAEKVVAHGKSLTGAMKDALKTHKQHELIADYVHPRGTIVIPTTFEVKNDEKRNSRHPSSKD